jgi:heme-degrading monooxygenase HmoA
MTAFRVLLRMRVQPGSGAAFERDWQEGAARISTQRTNISQWLARSSEDEEVYVVVSDWTDEESFRDYERSEAHQQHLERLRPHRKDGTTHTMTVVATVPGAAQ